MPRLPRQEVLHDASTPVDQPAVSLFLKAASAAAIEYARCAREETAPPAYAGWPARHCAGRWLIVRRLRHHLSAQDVSEQTGLDQDQLMLLETGLAAAADQDDDTLHRLCSLLAHDDVDFTKAVIDMALGLPSAGAAAVFEQIHIDLAALPVPPEE